MLITLSIITGTLFLGTLFMMFSNAIEERKYYEHERDALSLFKSNDISSSERR